MIVMYYSSYKMLKYSEYFNIYSIISRIALKEKKWYLLFFFGSKKEPKWIS